MAKALTLLTIDSNGTLAGNAPLMLHMRLGELLSFAKYIDEPRKVSELHAMRIAAKRLRYTMELLLPYVQDGAAKTFAALLDTTKKLQEMIGEIHDRDVRVPLIARFTLDHSHEHPEIRPGLVYLIEHETIERARLYGELIDYWHKQRAGYAAGMLTLIAALGQGSETTETAARADRSGQ